MKHLVIIACLLFSLGASAQSLTMIIENEQSSGGQITYDVRVRDFTNIVALQYSISYDSSVVSLVAINEMIIPSMNITNFDTTPGSIVNVWFDSSLNGVTLPNNSILYKLVFDVKTFGNPMVCFNEEPREPEILQGEETLLDLYVIDDCHDTPFLFHDAMTAVVDVFELAGVTVDNVARTGNITINVQGSKSLAFSLKDIQGKTIALFPETTYTAGQHILRTNKNVPAGIYFLVLQHKNHISSTRILFIE